MPLYRPRTDSLDPVQLKRLVRHEYERAVLSSEPASVETNSLIHVGPRGIGYGDDRALLAQMSGCRTEAARKQMAYTYLAVGSVMRDLVTDGEV